MKFDNTTIREALKLWRTWDNTTCINLYGNISNWDTSEVTDMSYLFHEKREFNDDISSWNVSNVTNMDAMFKRAESFNQDIGSWDVSNVTNMNGMFREAESFNQDIGSWDVSKVIDMRYLFFLGTSFCQDISLWNFNKAVKMKDMLFGAKAYEKVYEIKTLQKKYDLTSLNSEDKKIINKIKKLIICRDYNQINVGIELLRSIDNPKVYEFFLNGNIINDQGFLVTSKLLTGTRPAQPYLDYVLISLINFAPNNLSVHKSINRHTIKSIILKAASSEVKRVPTEYSWEEIVTEDCGKYSTENLPQFEFENLEELTLINYSELKSLDFLSMCKNLIKLSLKSCNKISNLDVLDNCKKLKSLDIENCENLTDFNGIKDL